MMPNETHTPHSTQDHELQPGDEHIVVTEERRGGVAVTLMALIVAAALIFSVWYLVASDEESQVEVPGVADIPEVDLGVDPPPDN